MNRAEFEKHRELILAFLQAQKFEKALNQFSYFSTDECYRLYDFEIDLLRFQVISTSLAFSDSNSINIIAAGRIGHDQLRYALARQLIMYGLLQKNIEAARYGISLLPITKDLPFLLLHVRALMIELDCSSKAIEDITTQMVNTQQMLIKLAIEESGTNK